MISGFQSIPKIPELRKRITFTLILLAIYRLGVYIPAPGVDVDVVKSFFTGAAGNLFSLFDLFAGGALENFSIFVLGIMPYISASIILQLLTVVVPHLERLSKEGELGRKKIVQYTRYGTIILSIIQGFGISVGLEQMQLQGGASAVLFPGWSFRIMTVITLTAGTAFIMWLGEQITERGIGNGISLIIFAGIVARIPSAIINTLRLFKAGEIGVILIFVLLVIIVAVVGAIIFVERGQRRLPVQYAKRVVGKKMYGGQSTHLPLKVNTAGVIPPIFASSILMFPLTIANFLTNEMMDKYPFIKTALIYLGPGRGIYNLLYVALIIFFSYFYTAITFNPMEVADNIKKYGGYIPGIRPGKKTSEYIDKVLSRITFLGAIYLSVIAVIPTVLSAQFNIPFYFGGTALLIVVGVALDTISQIETHMLTRHYEGFLKKGKFKGRR